MRARETCIGTAQQVTIRAHAFANKSETMQHIQRRANNDHALIEQAMCLIKQPCDEIFSASMKATLDRESVDLASAPASPTGRRAPNATHAAAPCKASGAKQDDSHRLEYVSERDFLTRMWTPEEDRLLIDAVTIHGKQWRLIAAQYFSNGANADAPRNCACVRNRFLRIDPDSRKGFQLTHNHDNTKGITKRNNKCRRCGQRKRGHVCSSTSPIEERAPSPSHEFTPEWQIVVSDLMQSSPSLAQMLLQAASKTKSVPIATAYVDSACATP